MPSAGESTFDRPVLFGPAQRSRVWRASGIPRLRLHAIPSQENTMKRLFTPALTLVAGIAIGAVAVHSLHAQAKPPGYYIAEITVNDQNGYMKEFVPPATKSLQEQNGKFVVRGGKTIAAQGAAPAPRVVVIQFESLDKAEAWWNSPAQKAAQAIGDKYASFHGFLVEGLAQ
jgi:uncharacterized protein (DUF1330 family)